MLFVYFYFGIYLSHYHIYLYIFTVIFFIFAPTTISLLFLPLSPSTTVLEPLLVYTISRNYLLFSTLHSFRGGPKGCESLTGFFLQRILLKVSFSRTSIALIPIFSLSSSSSPGIRYYRSTWLPSQSPSGFVDPRRFVH